MNKKNQKEYESERKKLMYWVAYLRLSRSYTIARAYKLGKVSKENAYKEVNNLDKVIEINDKFGNVWKNPIEWLDENIYEIRSTFTGAVTPEIVSILDDEKIEKKEEITREVTNYVNKDWAVNGHQPSMLVSIPLGVKKNYLFEFLKNALEQHENKDADQKKDTKTPQKFELTKEVVRMDALEKAYNLVMMKAANREMPNWELAENLGLCANSVAIVKKAVLEKEVNAADVETEAVSEAHKSINAVIWRYTRFAYVLAENAARGEFPKAMRETKEEREKRQKEYKKKYTKLKPEFLMSHLHRQSIYFQRQLRDRGMEHKYANEFLVPEAKINREWEPASVALAKSEQTMMHEAHENFLKHRRTYPPLPSVDEEEN